MQTPVFAYGGFWRRTVASFVDGILISLLIGPMLYAIYGEAYFDVSADPGVIPVLQELAVNLFLAFIVLAFWVYKQATPGKMLLSLKVVDAQSGLAVTWKQGVIRYLGYIVATLPFLLGFFWIAFDARKQGWHDKLASTVVVRTD